MPEETVERAVRESFARQCFLATIGAKLIRVVRGEVDVELANSERVRQQAGSVHAGAITTIADVACGYAALTTMPEGADVVSVEFKVNLLAPARGERVVAKARVVRAGRTLTVCTADVFADDTLVATMLGTFYAINR
ncbi:MAG TPA: PaaI family thioesterase [Thermoanaerobaculia bacterium]|nr:PaaI family thioesterase [Thermoanaerobaculia bacterium]